jgi:PhzF family phenazine biosynthesis protein
MNHAPRYYIVDAFTDQPFAGNPAAVVPLASWPSNQWMQRVAMELNLSETAYIVGGDGNYELRWFTPTTEVELCGHATLASAHTLWQHGYANNSSPITFHTHSGPLVCTRRDDSIELDFPLTAAAETAPPDLLQQALRVSPIFVGKSPFDYLVVVDNADIVREIAPDFPLLKQIAARGFIVTAASDQDGLDFISRFFAPAAGVEEDPVTGSAHCCLAPYWATQLGKNNLVAYQASRRGGTVSMQILNDRVVLGGKAITVMQGELLCT